LLTTEPRWPLSRNLSNGPMLCRTKSSLLRLVVFRVCVQLRIFVLSCCLHCDYATFLKRKHPLRWPSYYKMFQRTEKISALTTALNKMLTQHVGIVYGGPKLHTQLMAIILSNLNRFSKFFYGKSRGHK